MKKILLATLMFLPVAFAGSLPKNIDGYLPEGRFVDGANVKVNFPDEYAVSLKPLQEAVIKISKEKPELLQEIQKDNGTKPDEPIPYDKRLGVSRGDYDKYIAQWNKREIVPVEAVQVSLKEAGEGKWKLLAFTQTPQGLAPLPLSNLVYDSKKDVWTSPNGELARKDDVKFGKNNLFGEWGGPQWVLEEKDSLSTVIENFALGKTPSGNIFLVYRLMDVTSTGQVVSQNMYVIRIEAKALKEDPLKAAAKEKAKR